MVRKCPEENLNVHYVSGALSFHTGGSGLQQPPAQETAIRDREQGQIIEKTVGSGCWTIAYEFRRILAKLLNLTQKVGNRRASTQVQAGHGLLWPEPTVDLSQLHKSHLKHRPGCSCGRRGVCIWSSSLDLVYSQILQATREMGASFVTIFTLALWSLA